MRSLDWLSLVRFVAFMAAIARIVGSNSSNTEENQNEGPRDKELTKPLDSCSLIIVSTLDGKLSALDTRHNGRIRWSLPAFSGPLLSSSLSSLQGGKQVKIIPSLDGGLYQINGDKIEPIPYTADNLLGSFLKLQDGSMLVGGKEAISCGIDSKTGKVRYLCSADGCQLTDQESEGNVQDSDLFVVKRTQQTIRAVDQRTGGERWNFSVGQQDIVFLDSPTRNGERRCPVEDGDKTVDWKLRVSIPEGLLAAVNLNDMHGSGNDIVLWSHKFEAPIAAVWMLHGSSLKSVDLFSNDVMPGLRDGIPDEEANTKPIMYLGSHDGQFYIQHSKLPNPYLEPPIKVQAKDSKEVARRPRAACISWQPKLATSASRTPTVVSKDIAVWNPVEYPFDNGYFFFGDVQPVVPPHETRIKDTGNKTVNKTKKNGNVDQSTLSMEYWKGAVFVVILLVAVAQYVFRFLLPRHQQVRSSRIAKASLELLYNNCKYISSRIGMHIQSSASFKNTVCQREQSLTSSASTVSLTSNFISRYLTDFEHELCLGKGGFGVVFQAKNKVDDCQYAIKRVRLPNCDEAREKVMREVKALAQLEHPSIVRYYNSWFESPPVGWLEDNDKIYLSDRTTSDLEVHSGINICNTNGYSQDMVIRRRKTTSSSTKSKHSNSFSDDGVSGRRATLKAGEEDLSVPFDINKLENEAFLPDDDTSDSFGIEFVDTNKSEAGQNGLSWELNRLHLTESDGGIVFSSHNNEIPEEEAPSTRSKSSNSKSSNDICASFTTSGQSLLSGKHHKCKSDKCTQDTIQAPLYLFIQMQLCQRESLKDWLKINTHRDHISCLGIFEQIVHAVEYFHGRGMMHRDLKPSNIFFSLDGSVKVGDFGLVTASVQEPTDNPTKGKNGFIDANHTGQVGTHLYMSPEQMEGKAYSYKVDVYSLGLIFFELFHSFSTEMERITILSEVRKKSIPDEFRKRMNLQAQLVTWMLSDSPKHRPTATEVRGSDVYKKIVEDVEQRSKLKAE
ncbi:hypothetical protein QZH41_014214 [Actinostola sp. cb2023]|nr:hypothetical protein QZH41_014214 [Actinostola sp. cb2023]